MNKHSSFLLGAAVTLGLAAANLTAAAAPQQTVNLRSAGTFAVLAGQTVTNTDTPTIINGDLGVSPGTAVTGFPPGVVNGTIYTATTICKIHQACVPSDGAFVGGAIGDLGTAYGDAIGRTVGAITLDTAQLGGRTLTPGLYKSPSTAFDLTGTLTLAGKGVYIFQMTAGAAGLTVANNASVSLTKGAKAEDVFWAVSSGATLGTYSVFVGTIMAYTESITMATGATLDGRALEYLAAVTFDDNIVTLPTTTTAKGKGKK